MLVVGYKVMRAPVIHSPDWSYSMEETNGECLVPHLKTPPHGAWSVEVQENKVVQVGFFYKQVE